MDSTFLNFFIILVYYLWCNKFITNFNVLKQYEFILLRLWGFEVWYGSPWARNKVSEGLVSSVGSRRELYLLICSSF